MLSYLHGYHAGNAADALKHSALIFCLAYLKSKEKPLLCVDTHAGAGWYKLGGDAALLNNEWEKGLGLLLGQSRDAPALPAMVDAYIKFFAAEQNGSGMQNRYAGSPAIMARFLEKGDRLVCFELHPREFEVLSKSMEAMRKAPGKGNPVIEVRREDGLAGLKCVLPPPSRRALILIDPSWEEQSEFETVPRTVREALKRFPQGTYIIWYPLLARPKGKAAAAIRDSLLGLSDGLSNGECCRVELYTAVINDSPMSNSPRGMYGSGLVIYNPPWTLRPALEESMPYLAKVLGGRDGGWDLQ